MSGTTQHDPEGEKGEMARLGFIYEMDRCIGCKACQMACKDRNNLEVGVWFRRVETLEEGGLTAAYSGACNHCAEPACAAGCPSGALYTVADGTVGHHGGRCIGCGACVWNCPYGAPVLRVAKGIAGKCDGCADLRAEGEQPACVAACLTHCLHFGDVDDIGGRRGVPVQPAFLPDPARTRPALAVLRGCGKGEEA